MLRNFNNFSIFLNKSSEWLVLRNNHPEISEKSIEVAIRSCLEVFCKECVCKNYEKLTGKPLFWRFFFDKVAGWRLWKKDLPQAVFCKFIVIFKNIDIVEHLRTAASKAQKDFWKISLKELVFRYSLRV